MGEGLLNCGGVGRSCATSCSENHVILALPKALVAGIEISILIIGFSKIKTIVKSAFILVLISNKEVAKMKTSFLAG